MTTLVRSLAFALSLLLAAPVYAVDFALVQSAAPTSITTQDFTSSGFGTPLCGLFWASYGVTNNTVAAHSMLAIGATDGTRSFSHAVAALDALVTMDTVGTRDVDAALFTLSNTALTQDSEFDFSAFITDGIRGNWSEAPPAAYLINALLVGGTVINCYVGSAVSPAVQDTATDVTAPGFEPDIVISFGSGIGTTGMHPTVGITVNDGSNTAYALAQANSDNQANSVVSGTLDSQRSTASAQSTNPTTTQIQDFDSSGFSLYSRDGATARTVNYMAIKLGPGVGKALVSCDTPTGTGAHSCTGAGGTPQLGLMLLGEWADFHTEYGMENSETIAIGAFTATTALVAGLYSEDGDGTSTEKSMTNTIPLHLYKDGADYMKATFTAMTGDGMTLNYSVTPAGAKKRIVLFVNEVSSALLQSPRVPSVVFQ